MEYLGLFEVALVFGGVMGWSWYEYRSADREAKRMRRQQVDREKDKASDQLNCTGDDHKAN